MARRVPPCTTPPPQSAPSTRGAFAVYVAAVLTVVIVLFPPFTSIDGTEYAFVLTGPEWTRLSGLTPRIYWAALGVQLGTVWALALGARWFFGRNAPPPLLLLAFAVPLLLSRLDTFPSFLL